MLCPASSRLILLVQSRFPSCLPPALRPQPPGWWTRKCMRQSGLIPVLQVTHSIHCSFLSLFSQRCCNVAILPSSAAIQATSAPLVSSSTDSSVLRCPKTLNPLFLPANYVREGSPQPIAVLLVQHYHKRVAHQGRHINKWATMSA